MENTLVKSLFRESDKFAGKTVKVSGWVRTIRSNNNFGFIELNDGSFFKNLQVVFENTLDNFKEISKIAISSSLEIEGEVVLTPDSKQPLELKATNIVIHG